MRHIASLLVLGALVAPVAPLAAIAEELVEVPVIEEVLEETEEIVEETVEEPEEPVETPPEEPEVLVEEFVEEEEEVFEAFSLLSTPEEETGTVVYDFPTGVWGAQNGAFVESCRPYPPLGRTAENLNGAWDDVACEFSRWHDSDTSYEFDTLQAYLTTQNVTGTADYPLTAGTITVRIYETDQTWNASLGTLIAESEELDATTIAQHQTTTVCSGTGTAADPYTSACLASFTFSDTVTLETDKYYVFELAASGVVSPTQLFKGYYYYMHLAMMGASVFQAPFGMDGIQESPANNTGSVYMRLVLSEPEKPRILFLPGFLGSRLYAVEDDRKLWEPGSSADIEDLAFDDTPTDIYVGDVVDDIHNFPFFASVYGELMEHFDELKNEGKIEDWQGYPYDWRYDVFDVIDDGVLREDGSRDYLLDELEALAGSGKVTIVAHSNGGLLAKALMIRLEEQGKEDLVERIIMIGTPQVGTPKGMLGLLHGHDILPPFLLLSGTSRASAATMPGAYSLLPSEAYFSLVGNSVATFEEGTATEQYRNVLGEAVEGVAEALQFMSNSPSTRETPGLADEETPLPLSEDLLNLAADTHALLDAWTPPENVSVHSIAGWGNRTIVSANYVTERSFCFIPIACPPSSIDYEPVTVGDGDKTVLASSAKYMGDGVYFDLEKLSSLDVGRENRKHENLTESPKIHEFIDYLLNIGDSYDQDIFLENEPSGTGHDIAVSVHSPATISVTNEEGDVTGIFPLPDSDLYYIQEDISGSSVQFGGEGKYVFVPADGTYSVLIDGIGDGTMAITIQEFEGENEIDSTTIANLPVTENTVASFDVQGSQAPSEFSLDRDGDEAADITLAFHENETVIYQEPSPEESEAESGGSTRRTKKSSATSTQNEEAEVSPVQLWPNPYLLPPSPFTPYDEQESSVNQSPSTSTVIEQQNQTQTAAVYDAWQTIWSWIKAIPTAIYGWIAGILGF